MGSWTQADVDRVRARQGAATKPSKYRAQPKIVDSVRFDSTKEANRYLVLKGMLQAHIIEDLELQPTFELWAHVMRDENHALSVGEYRADFRYRYVTSREVVIEDVKSTATATPLYKLKRKLAEACHGISITEV